ncbi:MULTISPECIES: hypothetical protein [unclassified Romboutsia]|uniref:hypothetical protein n=1 Tax=unclassified Romboutsia TaxID=2626894 RepID=UPI000821C00E|nr:MULTISPECIES: hypothetical protein [unclassified Romboutsia]SCH30739.1 Uncharacterised protein [uncultured Clostridium sp.]
MKKFTKVSICIIVSILLFIGINKLIFNKRVGIEDYKITNPMYTYLQLDKYKKTDNGTVLRLKVKNSSNYTYRLEDASLVIWSCNRSENGNAINSREAFRINRIEYGINDDIRWKGIEPKGESYIEFLFPKGMSIDERFIDLESTAFEYKGSFIKELPLLDDAYTTVGLEEQYDSIQRLDKDFYKNLKGE